MAVEGKDEVMQENCKHCEEQQVQDEILKNVKIYNMSRRRASKRSPRNDQRDRRNTWQVWIMAGDRCHTALS